MEERGDGVIGRVWLGSREGVAEPAREYEVDEECRCAGQRARWEGGHWFVAGAFAFAGAVTCVRVCARRTLSVASRAV